MGWEPLVAPLLEVRPLEPKLDLSGVGSLAFTSRNGVRAFAALSPRRDLPVYAVGDSTAAAADDCGFADVRSADGDVEALAGLIGRERPFGIVLNPGPISPAGDLAALLEGSNVRVRSAPVYETTPLPIERRMTDVWPGLAAVLVHSPKAAEALSLAGLTPGPPVLCISEKAAAALRPRFPNVRAAAAPTEAALLALLGKPRPAG